MRIVHRSYALPITRNAPVHRYPFARGTQTRVVYVVRYSIPEASARKGYDNISEQNLVRTTRRPALLIWQLVVLEKQNASGTDYQFSEQADYRS